MNKDYQIRRLKNIFLKRQQLNFYGETVFIDNYEISFTPFVFTHTFSLSNGSSIKINVYVKHEEEDYT